MAQDTPISTEAIAPPAQFNFARHIMDINAGRANKTAYIDDRGTLTYGELSERVRRMAAGLLAQGVHREERVLLLMHDCNDWPVSFLGAMYAGIVPVAVNTLLTAVDYAYMLKHSRAQVALVSAALLPALQEAMAMGGHEIKTIVVSHPADALPTNAVAMPDFLAQHAPLAAAADTLGDDPGFWLYSSGSTGRPKGAVHPCQPLLDCAAVWHAGTGLERIRHLLLGRKAVFCLRSGQCAELPLERGCHRGADGRAPHTRRHFCTLDAGQAHRVFWRTHRLCWHVGIAQITRARGRCTAAGFLCRRGLACGYWRTLHQTLWR